MQQRQPRLGDILDDYCPRERRVTNHVVVAMIAEDVKQTRCTTCDADHDYKHAKVPRQRRKAETPAALYVQVIANAPKRVTNDAASTNGNGSDGGSDEPADLTEPGNVDISLGDGQDEGDQPASAAAESTADEALAADGATGTPDDEAEGARDEDDGPIHRRLIRAALPRTEGQQLPARPIPEFTIRQPGGRPNRFRPRGAAGGHQRGGMSGGQQFQGNRSNGGGNMPGGPPRGMRSSGGRPLHGPQGAVPARLARRNGPDRKRSK